MVKVSDSKMLTKKEETRRRLPTDELQKKLKPVIGEITPYEPMLERILKEWGFNLPGWNDDDETTYYGFYQNINGTTYMHLYPEYVDALAEEILFIVKHKMI